MIFKSVTKMNHNLLDHPTTTTNGIESYHRNLYRVVKKNKDLLTGLKVQGLFLDTEILTCI
jgi:hypothetical protein